MNGDNCGQNDDNESLYLHGLKMCVAYEFVVCVTLTNYAELFLMPSRLKSHIILVLDRLQCVARVNCLQSCQVELVEFLESFPLSPEADAIQWGGG